MKIVIQESHVNLGILPHISPYETDHIYRVAQSVPIIDKREREIFDSMYYNYGFEIIEVINSCNPWKNPLAIAKAHELGNKIIEYGGFIGPEINNRTNLVGRIALYLPSNNKLASDILGSVTLDK